jgi:hypothetical protein
MRVFAAGVPQSHDQPYARGCLEGGFGGGAVALLAAAALREERAEKGRRGHI